MPSSKPPKVDHALRREVAGPRSLTRLLALFDALSAAPDGLTLAELSTLLGSPKSSLLNLLRPLVAEAYLIHGGVTYRLGPSMFRLASGVLESWQLPKIVRPFMNQLAEETGETVLLSVIDVEKGMMMYIDIVHSAHPVRYQIAVGTVRPLYASTGGRVLLAYAEREWRDDYLGHVQLDAPTATPVTRTGLKRELEQIRQEGVGWSVDRYMLGLSAVGAPIFDARGECIACLNIAGPTDRFRPDVESLKLAVRSSAARVTEALAAAANDTAVLSAATSSGVVRTVA